MTPQTWFRFFHWRFLHFYWRIFLWTFHRRLFHRRFLTRFLSWRFLYFYHFLFFSFFLAHKLRPKNVPFPLNGKKIFQTNFVFGRFFNSFCDFSRFIKSYLGNLGKLPGRKSRWFSQNNELIAYALKKWLVFEFRARNWVTLRENWKMVWE